MPVTGMLPNYGANAPHEQSGKHLKDCHSEAKCCFQSDALQPPKNLTQRSFVQGAHWFKSMKSEAFSFEARNLQQWRQPLEIRPRTVL
jgi:hypothetical protein